MWVVVSNHVLIHTIYYPLAIIAPRLLAWLTDWEKGRTPESEKALTEGLEKRLTLYLEVQRILTPQQRERALHKLQDYIDDIYALAARQVADR